MSGLKRPSKNQNKRLLRRRNEDPSLFVFREIRSDDLTAITKLHVKAWAETYWQIKQAPGYELREWQWKEQFTITNGSWFCYVVENQKKELIGFVKGRIYERDRPPYSGELNKLYLLQEYQRMGLGRKLMCMAAARFIKENIATIILFGEATNPSCAFYDAIGGKRLIASNGDFDGGYVWNDLVTLASACNGK